MLYFQQHIMMHYVGQEVEPLGQGTARRYYVTTNRPGFVDSFSTIVMNQV